MGNLLPVWFRLDNALYSMPVPDVLNFVICAEAIAHTYRTIGKGGQ